MSRSQEGRQHPASDGTFDNSPGKNTTVWRSRGWRGSGRCGGGRTFGKNGLEVDGLGNPSPIPENVCLKGHFNRSCQVNMVVRGRKVQSGDDDAKDQGQNVQRDEDL